MDDLNILLGNFLAFHKENEERIIAIKQLLKKNHPETSAIMPSNIATFTVFPSS